MDYNCIPYFIRFHYDPNFNPDEEVLFGLHETIEKMIPDRRTRFTIDQQLDRFKTSKGLFGRSMAIDTRETKQPGELYCFTVCINVQL